MSLPVDAAFRRSFAARMAAAPSFRAIVAAAKAAKTGEDSEALASAFCHAAFAAPASAAAIYDAFEAGWFGEEVSAADISGAAEFPAPEFWAAFWSVVDDARAGRLDALGITGRVAALASLLPKSFQARAEMSARTHPKAATANFRNTPPRLRLDDLARQPAGSLGRDFHRLIVDNQFDLEVLDREALGLSQLPPALRFLNTRILQMHDVWHLVGGFRTTVLHEIAISAFQLAQFGHGYSAMFLATITTIASLGEPDGAKVILQTIAEGWRHGRASPSFMAIEWEREWALPIDMIRAQHGIAPFAGLFPADLIEQTRAAA